MAGGALPGTALAEWLRRVGDDPAGPDRRADHIRHLLDDSAVAELVKEGLARRAAAGTAPVGPTWLGEFLKNTEGGMALHLRLGDTARRLARLRHAVYAGASEAVLGLLPH